MVGVCQAFEGVDAALAPVAGPLARFSFTPGAQTIAKEVEDQIHWSFANPQLSI